MSRSWPCRVVLGLLMVASLTVGCNNGRAKPPVGPTPTPDPTPTPTPPPAPAPKIAVLVGAGDIADCANASGGPAEATAKLLDKIAYDAVFTAGDNAYFNATRDDFQNCYAPRWGRHRSRTFPTPGNHEYQVTPFPYFDYFGDRAGPRGAGFYSYTLGNWHIIALNSEVAVTPGQEQYLWLQRDLEENKLSATARCTLAYWHHPLFTSGPSAGSNARMREAWKLLYDYGADVIINGHDHLYERFDGMDPNGRRDNAIGIHQYTVGTGGAPLYDFGPALTNSAFRLKAYGVLKLTLRDVSYDSAFIEIGTELLQDQVFGTLCH
jgi:hypothetical protein